MENKYYIYEWIRLDTNEPFYVGKGFGNRSSINRRNTYFNNTLSKIGIDNVAVSIIHENLEEKIAFEYEVYYIYLYTFEFGFNLTNLTCGGEGKTGYKFNDEQRQNLSRAMKKVMENPEIRKKVGRKGKLHSNYGKKMSDETKLKNSLSNKGKQAGEKNARFGVILSDEIKKKISESNKGKHVGEKNAMYGRVQPNSKPIIVYKDNELIGEFPSAYQYSKTIGGTSPRDGITKSIASLANGWIPKRGKYLGYKVYYKES